ncbi:hypothetical protein MMC07_000872 [Pseudocyphellaria aurata]|nr:hypothetical protein [Pseudocyphellaria aurata]
MAILDWMNVRELLHQCSALTNWKVLTIIFALLNLRSLPLVWHIRVLGAICRLKFFPPAPFTPKTGPAALFRPMIISSRVNLLDCDYNLHKSNSTYFVDFDMSRVHLWVSHLAPGIINTSKELGLPVNIHLGGVSCNFKKEIKPFETFEVWTRVLCWDRKWLYSISHFVKKGSVRPKGYLLQPWRQIKLAKIQKKHDTGSNGAAVDSDMNKSPNSPVIFASAISKYVFKQGRLTISPEKILQNNNLLPPKPAVAEASSPPKFSANEGTSDDAAAASPLLENSSVAANEIIDLSLKPHGDGEVWDWDRIESERQRGMRIAKLFAGLEALNDECKYDDQPALGKFRDLY